MPAAIHDADGAILGVAEEFSGLREPPGPLSAEITALAGITPAMLMGQAIGVAIVAASIAAAHRVCCHNANFDRGFAERFATGFAHPPWVCSLREVDWAAVGTKLEHLLGRFGLFHSAHPGPSTTAMRCWRCWPSRTRPAARCSGT